MKLCQHDECAKVSETIYEKKDACYTKVKSRYDVWPSAYASGALVKCRKVGAANWGNKSKKEGVNEEILKEDIQDLKKIVKELEGASKMHAGQAKRIQSHLDSMNVKESIIEGTFGKFDTGAGFKGNGMTVYDRNQEKAGDYKDIAHIAPNGKITIYDKNVKKEPKLMQSLNKISQEFKKTFKESVDEGKLSEDYKNSEWEVYVADENGKEKIMKKAKSKRAGVILYNKLINSDNYYEVGMRVVKESVDEGGKGSGRPKGSGMSKSEKQKQKADDYAQDTYKKKKPKKFKKDYPSHLADMGESVDEGMTKQQADVTLKQLGANKFIAMTGAKQFSFGKQGLGFRIGKNSKSINYVRVDLKSNDLYDMEFIRIRGSKIKVVKKVTGVYNDQLQKIFTKHTGLYTSL